VHLVELPAQLGDGPPQSFQFGALFVAQLDAPIPRLTRLSHGRCFAVPRPGPAPRAPVWSHPSVPQARRHSSGARRHDTGTTMSRGSSTAGCQSSRRVTASAHGHPWPSQVRPWDTARRRPTAAESEQVRLASPRPPSLTARPLRREHGGITSRRLTDMGWPPDLTPALGRADGRSRIGAHGGLEPPLERRPARPRGAAGPSTRVAGAALRA
jgi:hypothetical protein